MVLANHSVPRSEIDRTPTKFVIRMYKQESSRSSELKSNLNHKNNHELGAVGHSCNPSI
jgi:hypothetical protein